MSEDFLVFVLIAIVTIVFVNALSQRIGVAGPLLLVAVGVGVSLLPMVDPIEVAPEIILVGVLPPLLYSAAVSAPAIELRRDITAIGGLSVLLVVISALVLGLFFAAVIPGIGFPLGVALGAILSPTDAVATSIVRKLGAPRRVVSVLEGEGLLNDATALVLLRTALVAAATGFSLLPTLGSFAWAVLSAVVIGAAAGALALRLRAWSTNATANTALGFTVPFLASLPTEALGGSGLVAAVVAGLVCGQGAVRWLTPEERMSDKLNWRTIEFLLEGAVFLIMGLELYGILEREIAAEGGVFDGVWIAAVALVVLLAVRAVYVIPMLSLHARRVKRTAQGRVDAGPRPARGIRRAQHPSHVHRLRADVEYFDASPLRWRQNALVIWAGMRGAVTLAAAQTLPRDTPERDLLVFIAFLVAAGSLLIQGLTLSPVVRVLRLRGDDSGIPYAEIRAIDARLRAAAHDAARGGTLRRADGSAFSAAVHGLPASRIIDELDLVEGVDRAEVLEYELALVRAMRARMHDLGRSGRFSTEALRYVLDELDAYEISVRLRRDSEG